MRMIAVPNYNHYQPWIPKHSEDLGKNDGKKADVGIKRNSRLLVLRNSRLLALRRSSRLLLLLVALTSLKVPLPPLLLIIIVIVQSIIKRAPHQLVHLRLHMSRHHDDVPTLLSPSIVIISKRIHPPLVAPQ